MSEISNVRLKECKIKLIRLTEEEMVNLTGKSYEELKKIADLKTGKKPKIFVRRDIQTDVVMDINTQGTEGQNIQKDLNNDEINKTQGTEDTSNTSHEIMPDSVPLNIPIYGEETNETQGTEDTSNTSHEIMPDSVPLNIPIYGEETNDTQETYAGFDHFMQYQQYDQNDMDMTTEENNFIYNNPPQMVIKQEVVDDNYGTYAPEVAGSSQIMIKQEVIDESYNYNNIYSPQGSHVYSEFMSNQPTQNFGVQSINPETSNPHVIIKQEVFDEGNIEVYTDVLRPSADQGYEDGNPW